MKNFYSESFIKLNEKNQLSEPINDEEFIEEMNFWESEEATVPTLEEYYKEKGELK